MIRTSPTTATTTASTAFSGSVTMYYGRHYHYYRWLAHNNDID